MKVINMLLALIVSALMALAVLEVGLRVIGLGPPMTLNAFDPNTGWGNKPSTTLSTSTPDGEDVEFSFNEFGLREGADVQPEKPSGTTRVVALGDSFTLGRYLDQEFLFLDRLEGMWDGVQFVNTGREGYSTDQEVSWLLANGDAWRPDVVLLFPYENDLFWCGESDYTGVEKPRFTADGDLEPRPLADKMARDLSSGTALGRLFNKRKAAPRFQPGSLSIPKEFGIVLDELPAFMEEPIARATGSLKALVKKCDELGAELIVVPIPSETAIHPAEREKLEAALGLTGLGWSGDNAVERFTAAATDAGVPRDRVLDIRPHFRARAEAGEVLYFERDWHLNQLGNAHLAEFLAQQLPELGVLPPAVRPLSAVQTPPPGLPGWLPFYLGLWALLGTLYARVYKSVEKPVAGFLKVGAMLGLVFTIALGGSQLIGLLPPKLAQLALIGIITIILGFVGYKLGDRIGTITELLTAFIRRGHWYLMPLVTVLLTVGSLLVVAASSPLVAPFIYTLF